MSIRVCRFFAYSLFLRVGGFGKDVMTERGFRSGNVGDTVRGDLLQGCGRGGG